MRGKDRSCLHADDETAQHLEDQPNVETEAWHILDASPGAAALVGLKDGVDREVFHEALLRQDFAPVRRFAAGEPLL